MGPLPACLRNSKRRRRQRHRLVEERLASAADMPFRKRVRGKRLKGTETHRIAEPANTFNIVVGGVDKDRKEAQRTSARVRGLNESGNKRQGERGEGKQWGGKKGKNWVSRRRPLDHSTSFTLLPLDSYSVQAIAWTPELVAGRVEELCSFREASLFARGKLHLFCAPAVLVRRFLTPVAAFRVLLPVSFLLFACPPRSC